MGTIGFGSPPVYTANPLPVLSNVFLVKNDDDGLSGGSLRTIMDIMLKLRAIDSLNYRKRDLLKMILDDSDDEESEEDSEESWMALDSMTAPESMTFPDDVEIIGFINKTDISDNIEENVEEEEHGKFGMFHVEESAWDEVEQAVASIPSSHSEPYLQHIGSCLLVSRRQDDTLTTFTNYLGSTLIEMFSRELTLSSDMLDDHMPWGYSQLFQGISLTNTTGAEIPLAGLHSLTAHSSQSREGFRSRLRNQARRLKYKTKNFFKNLG